MLYHKYLFFALKTLLTIGDVNTSICNCLYFAISVTEGRAASPKGRQQLARTMRSKRRIAEEKAYSCATIF